MDSLHFALLRLPRVWRVDIAAIKFSIMRYSWRKPESALLTLKHFTMLVDVRTSESLERLVHRSLGGLWDNVFGGERFPAFTTRIEFTFFNSETRSLVKWFNAPSVDYLSWRDIVIIVVMLRIYSICTSTVLVEELVSWCQWRRFILRRNIEKLLVRSLIEQLLCVTSSQLAAPESSSVNCWHLLVSLCYFGGWRLRPWVLLDPI